MSDHNSLDCIAMKTEAQEKLAALYAGLTIEEEIEFRKKRLAESCHPAAILWRGLTEKAHQNSFEPAGRP